MCRSQEHDPKSVISETSTMALRSRIMVLFGMSAVAETVYCWRNNLQINSVVLLSDEGHRQRGAKKATNDVFKHQ